MSSQFTFPLRKRKLGHLPDPEIIVGAQTAVAPLHIRSHVKLGITQTFRMFSKSNRNFIRLMLFKYIHIWLRLRLGPARVCADRAESSLSGPYQLHQPKR
jgi:hypothetical protein